MKWSLKGGISIDADSGPPRYVLWCCGGICHQVLSFIQIGCSHTDGSPKIGYNFCFLALMTSIWNLANFWSTYLKVAWSQKVFWLWPHCQQKVPNYSPEQKIWKSCLLLNSNFLLGVIWHLSFRWQWNQIQNTFWD